MQFELDEQVHQYDADTWGEREEQRTLDEYLGQIHLCHVPNIMSHQINTKVATTSYSVRIISMASFLQLLWTGQECHVTLTVFPLIEH